MKHHRACLVVTVAAGCFFVTARSAQTPVGAQARPRTEMSTGACPLDLAGDKATTVFFLLGQLDEYMGRQIVQDGDVVERFYCDEHDKAALFRRYLDKLAAEQGIDPTVREETVQGCLVFFHSKPLADALNSCYRYTPTGSTWITAPDGRRLWTATGVFNTQLFYRSGFARTSALAYVSGAWARSRVDDFFQFANADDKAKRVAELLVTLGSRNVRLEMTFGYVPRANWVRFQPSQDVSDWLQRTW